MPSLCSNNIQHKNVPEYVRDGIGKCFYFTLYYINWRGKSSTKVPSVLYMYIIMVQTSQKSSRPGVVGIVQE